MSADPTRCPKCDVPLVKCLETRNMLGQELHCGALYCPKCHAIKSTNGKCGLDYPDYCPAKL